MDKIIIKDLKVPGYAGVDCWGLKNGQNLIFNVVGYVGFDESDEIDNKIC